MKDLFKYADRMQLTNQQEEIIKCNDDLIIINALAGTGKTSTLIEYVKARPSKRFLYIVFNKSMQKEAELKMKGFRNIEIKTAHSIAFQKTKDKLKLMERMNKKTLNSFNIFQVNDFLRVSNFFISKIFINVLNEFLFSEYKIDDFVKRFNSEYFSNETVMKNKNKISYFVENGHLKRFIFKCARDTDIHISHDFYLKFFQINKIDLGYDIVLTDEAQDISPQMKNIILNQSAKKIFVGDKYQSIYKFRGAVNALEKIENAKQFYLTNTFRFQKNSTMERWANVILESLGEKNILSARGSYKEIGTKAIISRTNSALFEKAHQLVSNGKKIYFEGGITGYNFNVITDIVQLKNRQLNKIYNATVKKFKHIDEFEEYTEQTEEQQLKTALKLAKKHNTYIYVMLNEIKENLAKHKENADYILTTAHKSKGQEYGMVELLSGFNILDKETKVMNEDEANLLYVAITRAVNGIWINEKIEEQLIKIEVGDYVK